MFRTRTNDAVQDRVYRLQLLRMRAIASQMLRVAERGADLAIATKGYTNRTWDLTNSTLAYIAEDSQARVQVNLDMGMPYATYIIEKGLSDFPDIAEGVAVQLDNLLNQFTEAGGAGFVTSAGGFSGPHEGFYT